jgi:hypothetical protein
MLLEFIETEEKKKKKKKRKEKLYLNKLKSKFDVDTNRSHTFQEIFFQQKHVPGENLYIYYLDISHARGVNIAVKVAQHAIHS